jgi:hypothetical protein
MKYLLFLLLISTASCYYLPNSKKDPNHVTIDILQPVNNYNISIKWYPAKAVDSDDFVGPATMELENIKTHSKQVVKYTSLEMGGYLKDVKIQNGIITDFSDSDYGVAYETMQKVPFYFYDVNFDGIKDLITVESRLFKNDERKINKIYAINNLGKLTALNSVPYNEFTNFYMDSTEVGFRNGTFDTINKEIIIGDYFGCCQWIDHVYKLNSANQIKESKTENHDQVKKKGFDVITTNNLDGKDKTVKIVVVKN